MKTRSRQELSWITGSHHYRGEGGRRTLVGLSTLRFVVGDTFDLRLLFRLPTAIRSCAQESSKMRGICFRTQKLLTTVRIQAGDNSSDKWIYKAQNPRAEEWMMNNYGQFQIILESKEVAGFEGKAAQAGLIVM
jgi:hypothetical protein